LLFTLSHVDESNSSDPNLISLAEKAGCFFSMAIVIGVKQGWTACALQLEKVTLVKFLCVQNPTYRLYMGLTYLVHLAALSTSNKKNSSHIDVLQTKILSVSDKKGAYDSDMLTDILVYNKFMLLKSLWWWSIGERSNFLIRRLALKCIAQTTVISSFAQFLWKLDPMPRLLEILSRSYRMRNHQQRIGFLQKEIFKDLQQDVDDDMSRYSDSYYGDSDASDGEEDKLPPIAEARLNDGKKNSPDNSLSEIKADFKLIRLILKTMVNLVQSSSIQTFSPSNRKQLIQYLIELEIGANPERGVIGISIQEVASRDRVVGVYFSILLEQSRPMES
jgi:hypothetical protein